MKRFERRDGNVKVILRLDPTIGNDGKRLFCGRIEVKQGNGGMFWKFDELRVPGHGGINAVIDRAARDAVSFGSCWTSDNRGSELPDYAPSAEFADLLMAQCAFLEPEGDEP